jgi:hypothetical protein
MSSPGVSGIGGSHDQASDDESGAPKRHVPEAFCCPHCGVKLSKWEVPDSPFNEWPSEYQYICFNDECSYFVGGWETLAAQGSFGSYRFMYDPTTGGCHPVAVLSKAALRDGIMGSQE